MSSWSKYRTCNLLKSNTGVSRKSIAHLLLYVLYADLIYRGEFDKNNGGGFLDEIYPKAYGVPSFSYVLTRLTLYQR